MEETSQNSFLLLVIFLLILANVYLWPFVFTLSDVLVVIFFDVGEGDSIFLVTPQGHQILIDGGPNERILEKLARQMPFWDHSLDLVVLTHPEYDHLHGLNKVLEHYQVERILWNGVERDTAVYKEWREKIKNEGAEIKIAQAGQIIKAGVMKGTVLWPQESQQGKMMPQDSNISSVVLKVQYGAGSFLLTGDLPIKAEAQMIANNATGTLKADVLKIGHHGSKSSTSKPFLAAVAPETAVISCGQNNRYGHPNQAVLQSLALFGIKVLRTDESGDILITADNKGLQYY